MKNEDIENSQLNVVVIDDKETLNKYRNEMYSMLEKAYADKGGFKGASNPRTLIKNTDRAKIVFDVSGRSILALSVYRTDFGGYKRFGSAGIKGNKSSLEAVNAIIKSDIEPYDNWYWVEASDAIEHLFEKNNGNRIPNYFIWHYLNMDNGDDRITLDDDGYHYFRNIAGDAIRKSVFGFKDENTKEMVVSQVSEIGLKYLRTDNMDKRIDESNGDINQRLREARVYLSRLFDLHVEEGFNEMLPEWRDMALDSINLIHDNFEQIPDNEKTMFKGALSRGETCLEEMTVLRFKKIEV